MVKLRTICRDPKDYNPEHKGEMRKVFRNPNKHVHPFQQAREYQRALRGAKLERMFAKPFISALSGHSDTIYSLAKNPNSLSEIVSGSADGEVIVWSLSKQKARYQMAAHSSSIKGLAFSVFNERTCFLSAGEDKAIRLWEMESLQHISKKLEGGEEGEYKPKMEYLSKVGLGNVTHAQGENIFATAGDIVQVWNYERSRPVQSFEWGIDTITTLKVNPAQHNLLLSTSMDRSICLYDLRGNTPLKKVTLKNKSSCAAWNPYEPLNFTIGNEDSNCYTFDMRKLEQASLIHKDHVAAVLDIDFAPTGKEFVTGSFDKTIRIFPYNSGTSREIYHTKRMQQIFTVLYTMDNRFILSGSDDTNIRLWKASASDPINPVVEREKVKISYYDKLKKKYKHNQEIKRILRHRHIPKLIYKLGRKRVIKKESKHRKLENVKANSKPGTLEYLPERKTHVVDLEI